MMERSLAAKQGDKPMELPIKAWEERGGSKITDHPLEGKKIGEENGGRPFFVQDYFPRESIYPFPLPSLSPPSSFASNFEKSLFEFSDLHRIIILVAVCG